MRSRNLKHKITIQKATITKNEFRERIKTFSKLGDARASVENFTSNEKFFSNSVISQSLKKYRMRYRPDITTDMRILHNGVAFDIVSIVNPFEKNKELVIAVREVINE